MSDDIKIVGLANPKMASKTKLKIVSSIIGVIVLAIGVIAGIFLVRQNQNINEDARECALDGFACPHPDNPSLLRDCSTGEIYPDDSICDLAGEVAVCGSSSSTARQYCCPSAGGAWTTNLTACAIVATPTPSPSPSPSPTSSPVVTASPTPTSAPTGAPNSCGGTCGSNSNCQSGLFCSNGFCRNASCSTDTDCICSNATSTPTPTRTPTTRPTATGNISSGPTSIATSVPVPVTGASWSTTVSVGFGVVMLLISLGLAL